MAQLAKPSRIDFESINSRDIERILKTGDYGALTEAERAYFDMMEMVRGLRARMRMPNGERIVTKAGIIKLLKAEPYGLSDWMARRVYADALNFFYSDDGVSPRAWANYYAERLDKLADLSAASGRLKEARSFIQEAARLRGCYDDAAPEIPRELLDAAPVVIYTSDPQALGAPKADRKKLCSFIDSIPDVPEPVRDRVKEDAGVEKWDLYKRMIDDSKNFGDEEDS